MAGRGKDDLTHIRTNRDAAGRIVSYTVRMELPSDPLSGARRQRSETVKTLPAAQDRRDRWRLEIRDGAAIDPTRLTVAELAQRWLDEEAAPTVRPTTLAGYRATIETHLIPHLGERKARGLDPADITAWRARLLKATGVRSTQLALLRLRQILTWAVSLDLVKRNVAAGVDLPKDAPGEIVVLSHGERLAFLAAAADDAYAPLWQLYMDTGLRRGEALGLRWRDLSLSRATLTVRQQVVLLGTPERPEVQPVKTTAGRRTIELDAALVTALRAHQERQRAVRAAAAFWREELDLVFCTRNGLPLNPNNVYRNFARIRAAAGIDDRFTLHGLRHTHATHLLLAGLPLSYVSKRLGHARESVTSDRYSHLVPGFGEMGRAALERAIRGQSGGIGELSGELSETIDAAD